MSDAIEPTATTADEGGRPRKGNGKLVARIVVYTLLLVVVVIGVMEYLPQRAAYASRTAIEQAEKKNPHLTRADIKTLIGGRPTVATDKPRNLRENYALQDVYTWSGLFRRHTMTVYYYDGTPFDGGFEEGGENDAVPPPDEPDPQQPDDKFLVFHDVIGPGREVEK
ncbi:MAG: hypothetical protein ACREJB_02455 [Planctomycetaceae bacterium]